MRWVYERLCEKGAYLIKSILKNLLPSSNSDNPRLDVKSLTINLKNYKKDNSTTMDAVQSLPPHQQKQFMERLEQIQMKDSLTMYTTLVHRCFDECVWSFSSKTLDKKEGTCVENCASRYVKATQRVGLRFAEHQAMTQQRAAQAAANAGAK